MSLRAALRARRAAPRAARTRSDSAGSEHKARLPGSLSAVPGTLQRKPVLGPAGDVYEREADAAAQAVTEGRPAPAVSPLGPGAVQRQAAGGTASAGAATAAAAVHSGGQPLGAADRSFFEPRFGADLSGVRIHRGAEVDRAAAAIDARAYTIGNDIAIASGAAAEGSRDERRLMAHELTHTLQQSAGQTVRRQSMPSLPSLPDLGDLEKRAKRWGKRQWKRGEDLVERGAKKAEKIADQGQKDAESWWNRGSGAITKMEFDGKELKVSGTGGGTYKSVSGLMAHNPKAKGTDYTGPEHQDKLDKGPIPEGTYYLEPAEVQSNPPHSFSTRAWGKYRTRLHETTGTALKRHVTSDRTGGFYLHQDADHNGTAGCIGLWNATDNKAVHAGVAANGAQIPVHVEYKTPPAPAPKTPAMKKSSGTTVRRMPAHRGLIQRTALDGVLTATPGLTVQRDPKKKPPKKKKKKHFLIRAGIAKIDADNKRFKGKFPSDYYDTLARHLYKVALRENGRDYGDAFSMLDDLQWNTYGPDLQNHYTRVFGTDSANGWDKLRHFVFTAYLQWYSGGILLPEGFTYGKELYDEAEKFFGKDPEGYSVPDIRADNKGEKFAEEMADQRMRELKEAAKRKIYRGLEALTDPRTYGVY